jgi:TonB-dependent SusC/RagA subfamily outer membrane receptor
MDRAPAESFERTLAAKVPGLIVSRAADGSLVLRLRTTSTILGNTEPLVIVDGSPVMFGPNGGLNGLNPRDIASIEVVKDVTSLALYGVRGANGVILVRTKAGSQ